MHQRKWSKFDKNKFILYFLSINWESTLELKK